MNGHFGATLSFPRFGVLQRMRDFLTCRIRLYWRMIKSLQTGLLLTTGLAGYMSSRCPVTHWQTLLALGGSLFLAISGSTVLNMWYDRDIDARMARTLDRPLPSGKIRPGEALLLGLCLSCLGVGWSLALDALYGGIVFLGVFFDVIVYTMWLKRRTCWSIIWGGISGGMPTLAGRALGVGTIDWIGIAFALAVLLWIPTHIMTFSLRYAEDYQRSGVPTFPQVYGRRATHNIIATSSLLAALAMGAVAYGIGMEWGFLRLFLVLSSGLLFLAIGSTFKPSEGFNFGLFKYASLYMLCTMLLILFS
jgi:protoheme IX farnesyltransferase